MQIKNSPPKGKCLKKILLSTLLAIVMFVGVVFLYWWPARRTSWEICRMNGMVNGTCQGYLISDDKITSAQLIYTGMDSLWLSKLRKCDSLEKLTLDGMAVGPGLKNLAGLSKLKRLSVIGQSRRTRIVDANTSKASLYTDIVDSTLNCGEFNAVSALEDLYLYDFKGVIYNIEGLKDHPKLHRLYLDKITLLPEFLEKLANCKNIDELELSNMPSVDEIFLNVINRFTHLKILKLPASIRSPELESRLNEVLPKTTIEWNPHN